MAREANKVPENREHENKPHEYNHSTKRQTVQAAGWIDKNTNLYIINRLAESKKLIDPKFTRSKVIAEMLKERAADDTFARSQAILAPLLQDVIRAEFRAFTNRFLWIIAKIAYQVGWILSLLLADIRLRRDTTTMHQMEVESEKDGRVYVAERSPQVEEAKERGHCRMSAGSLALALRKLRQFSIASPRFLLNNSWRKNIALSEITKIPAKRGLTHSQH
jgi:hypothetical protein